MSPVLPRGACSSCGRRDSRSEFRGSRQRNRPWVVVGGLAFAATRPSLEPTANDPAILIQIPKVFLIKYSCSTTVAFPLRLVPGDLVPRV